jgi:hypothetical protein
MLAVKPINTTAPIKEHKKYSYKLRELDITRVNQVWSADHLYQDCRWHSICGCLKMLDLRKFKKLSGFVGVLKFNNDNA